MGGSDNQLLISVNNSMQVGGAPCIDSPFSGVPDVFVAGISAQRYGTQ
jgi:hypothetical protein